ncbi:MAG TPA: glycogen-binding domain-containing protein [Gemmatimonadaceae bacterium]|nr:glycogen-binding domain-containing protein [Gemmatimonadaceae bacterium]
MSRRTGRRPATAASLPLVAVSLAATLLPVAPRPLRGQEQPPPPKRIVTTPSLDVGVSAVRYADSIDVSAATLSSGLRVESPRTALAVQGTFAQSFDDEWIVQGGLAGSAYTRAAGALVGELAASVGGSAHHDGTRTGETLALVRGHLASGGRGVWLGGGGGRTWDGAAWHGVALGEAGAWAGLAGGATLVATATPTAVDVGGSTVRYTDASLAGRWAAGRAAVDASLGTRIGHGPTSLAGGPASWGSVAATVWVAGPVALTASGGSYPVDYTQGYPGGRFVTAAVRVASRPRSTAAARVASGYRTAAAGLLPPAAPAIGDAAAPSLTVAPEVAGGDDVTPATDARRMLVVAVPASAAATAVELSGDFTSWDPVALARGPDGRWRITVALAAGVHQVVVRVNGGPWVVPAGLPTIGDEFGGVAGLLVVGAER